jgi:CRP-like cAMP-binding protein
MRLFLEQFKHFSREEIDSVLGEASRREVKDGSQLFLEGQVFSSLWFVEQGMIRAYRIINGQDFTYFFFTENQFAVDYQSYLTQTPSPLFFEALTETIYLEFSRATIERLYDRFPRFERLGRRMAEQAYLSAANRLKEFQTDDLETRYINLINRDPELFQRVPQHHIATYLGVKPQSLSRIRAKLARSEQN